MGIYLKMYRSKHDHEEVCPDFAITGKLTKRLILGVCNKCGEILERYEKKAKEPTYDLFSD